MDTQRIKSTSIDAQTLENLEKELQTELIQALNKGGFKNLLKKHGIDEPPHLHLYFQLAVEPDTAQLGADSTTSTTSASNCICFNTYINDWDYCPCPP
jgi:hypothetical protein